MEKRKPKLKPFSKRPDGTNTNSRPSGGINQHIQKPSGGINQLNQNPSGGTNQLPYGPMHPDSINPSTNIDPPLQVKTNRNEERNPAEPNNHDHPATTSKNNFTTNIKQINL